MIADGFGPISGLSRSSIEEVIRCPTLSGKKRINGRQLLYKAKIALRESKILLAYWNEFVKNGMPSGMTEVDALKYVVQRAFEEKTGENDEGDEEEDDNEEEERPVRQNIQSFTVLESRVDSDSEDDEGESLDTQTMEAFIDGYIHEAGEDGHDVDEIKNVESNIQQPIRDPSFYPAALVLFMLYGPYGVGQYGLELSTAFSIDTEGIDDLAKNGSMNIKSIKEEKKKEDDKARYFMNCTLANIPTLFMNCTLPNLPTLYA